LKRGEIGGIMRGDLVSDATEVGDLHVALLLKWGVLASPDAIDGVPPIWAGFVSGRPLRNAR
jgi:hypothetical protein